uniref:Major facilitator superfamily (MFS) profile domain-containing protein n=1 Tax=Strigamia maritima TaxID=126957 RepID=T1IIS5_STRMM
MSPSKESKSESKTLMVVFISLLIDLLAFTLILPLLPSLLDYYHKNDKGNLYLFLVDKINYFQEAIGAPGHFNVVLFGGFIGSLFSFLQFIASPVMGALSDIYGRKNVLLVSMVGEMCCYILWANATNFSIFVMSRIVGGISRGNVSICTAVIADISTKKTRGKGMAVIGIAFSIGFIVGPITGALFAHWTKTEDTYYFAWPAMLAFTLVVIDFVYLLLSFDETLTSDKRAKSLGSGLNNALNYINPSALFRFDPVQKVNDKDLKNMRKIGLICFFFLFLYSGLEYTLTFLTHIRFHVQQGKMFLYIGLLMAIFQGAFLRRLPVGREKQITLIGLCLIIPAFICIGFATKEWTLYLGLTMYSFASATVIPCLTTLICAYGSHQQKGTVMGIFRSLGALARALGPILASSVFWLFGARLCYVIGGFFLVIPLLLLRKLEL